MNKCFLLLACMSISLNAMEVEPTHEGDTDWIELMPEEVQSLIFTEVINHSDDIKDCYDAIKPFALTNRYYRHLIPDWFVGFWYTYKNAENHSKIALAAMCGAGGWIKKWLKEHRHNKCGNSICCKQDKNYEPYSLLLAKDNKKFIPWMHALLNMNKWTAFLLRNNNSFEVIDHPFYLGFFSDLYKLFNDEFVNADNKASILNTSIINKHFRVAHYLLSFFTDDANKKEYIQSLIYTAIDNNNPKIAQLALDHGADINKGSEKIKTPPLLCAAMVRKKDMFKFFLEAGAGPYLQDHEGETTNAYLLKNYQEAVAQQNQDDINHYGELIKLMNEHGLKIKQ